MLAPLQLAGLHPPLRGGEAGPLVRILTQTSYTGAPISHSGLQWWCAGYRGNMSAYSLDLREKIVESVKKGVSKAETARRFGVHRATVKRYCKLRFILEEMAYLSERCEEVGSPNPGRA